MYRAAPQQLREPQEYCQCGESYATTYSVATTGTEPCPFMPTSTGELVTFSTAPATKVTCRPGWCWSPPCADICSTLSLSPQQISTPPPVPAKLASGKTMSYLGAEPPRIDQAAMADGSVRRLRREVPICQEGPSGLINPTESPWICLPSSVLTSTGTPTPNAAARVQPFDFLRW